MKFFTFLRFLLAAFFFFYLIPGEFIQNAFADQLAKKGDNVTIEYVGSLEDGTVFDSSKNHDSPLEFIVGSGQVIPGFDKAVVGMRLMEKKKFILQPSEAYGERNPKLTHKVLLSELPPEPEPKPGMELMMGGPGGGSRRALITKVTKEHIIIDMNHPLAGKALTFKIKLIKVKK